MQESGFKSYDELPLFLNAKASGKNTGRVTVQWVRTHARTRLPGAAGRQPPGSAQGTFHSMGHGTHRRWL